MFLFCLSSTDVLSGYIIKKMRRNVDRSVSDAIGELYLLMNGILYKWILNNIYKSILLSWVLGHHDGFSLVTIVR